MTNQPEPVPPSVPPAGQLPPGFISPNGHPAPVAQLMQQLPQMIAQAMAAIFQQVPVSVKQLHCATCRAERLRWGAMHQAEFAAADQAWRAAVAEMEARAPEDRVPVDPAQFVPEHLRQGGPPVNDATVMIGGTLLCDGHIPGIPGVQAGGRKEFLIANAPLSSALIAEVMGQAAA